jgi:periplasmic divalent cation tolerance protein
VIADRDFIRIETAVADRKSGMALARNLVDSGTVAAVHMVRSDSCFFWEGETVIQEEYVLSIKTVFDQIDAVTAIITAAHPYKLPGISLVPFTPLTPDYTEWLRASSMRVPPAPNSSPCD